MTKADKPLFFYLLSTLAACLFTTAFAAPAELPDEAKRAASYLKALNKGKYDLTDITALSPNCQITWRKEIKEQLEFYAKTSLSKGDVYTFEEKKTVGKLSAILLRAENPTSPLSTRIHAIAMLEREKGWLPAPLPGSFANTGYGYDPEVEKSVKSLENWMSSETIKRQTAARKKASAALLGQITAREATAGLEKLSPEKTVLKLIEALREKDLMLTMAIIGAGSGETTEPLVTTINYVTRGLEKTDPSGDWHLVSSRSVIVEVMKVDKMKNEVAVGFWNPMGKNEEKILYFPYFKSGGKTFVKLSELLKIALLREDQRWRQRWRQRRGDETTLRKKLATVIFENSKPQSQPDSAKLLQEFLSIKKSGSFRQLITLLPREGDFFSKAENQKTSLQGLGNLWRSITRMEGNPMHVLNVLADDNIALAPLQFAKTNRPGEFETIKIWMIKLKDGWHVIPEDSLAASSGKETKDTMHKLEKELLSIQKEQQEKQSKELLGKVITLTPPLKLDPPTDEEVKKLISTFRMLLRTKDTTSAMSHCAVLKGTNSAQTLKIFNYAIRGAADQAEDDLTLGINRSGKWLGLSMRTTSKSSGQVDYPLFLIVNTEQGSKIMLDIDLREATNRGRVLLNQKAWRKLRETLPEDSLAEVKSLFKSHSKISTADIAKTKKEEEEEEE